MMSSSSFIALRRPGGWAVAGSLRLKRHQGGTLTSHFNGCSDSWNSALAVQRRHFRSEDLLAPLPSPRGPGRAPRARWGGPSPLRRAASLQASGSHPGPEAEGLAVAAQVPCKQEMLRAGTSRGSQEEGVGGSGCPEALPGQTPFGVF